MLSNRFIQSISVFLMTLVPTLFATSCKDDKDTEPAKSNLMTIHASPNAQGVDLLIDDTKVNVSTLNYSNTASFELNSGSHKIKISPAGSTAALVENNQNLEANKSYSLFVVNSKSDPAISTIESLIITDDLKAPDAGKAKVRFVHLSPDAPAIDIYSVGSTGSATKIFENRTYKSYTDFTAFDASTYTLQVRETSTGKTIMTLPPVQLTAGRILTVFAKGFVTPPAGNSNTLSVQVIEHQAQATK